MKKTIFIFLMMFLMVSTAGAVLPDEMLKDPILESRARAITRDLRCVVCQGQAIDDSNAELAADLRRLVRERLMAGDTDAAVLSYIQSRYGDYVLMTPPVAARTYLLWAAPMIVFMIGVAVVFVYVRASKKKKQV